MAIDIRQCILTQNDCYKAGKTIKPKGVMVHSTGANNPNLKRYLGPDDGTIGRNEYNNHWNRPGGTACVHAFIGKGQDGKVYTYQALPWTMRGWHGGGSSNDTHISFEICEDGLTDAGYFNTVYTAAAQLCAYLCREYGIAVENVICHSEGHKRGIASNHADVMHWFPKHGKSMDTLRADVAALLGNPKPGGDVPPQNPQRPQIRKGSKGKDVEDAQVLLTMQGFNLPKYGVDGLFGSETDNAVRGYQKAKGLAIDGIIGPKTWAALEGG